MSDGPGGASVPRGGILKWALSALALVGVVAVGYIIAQSSSDKAQADCSAGTPAAKTWDCKFAAAVGPAPSPAHAFNDPAGEPTRIADFAGKVVVMNLWATWCAPCKIEMPTLARLQAAYADQPVEVVVVSVDTEEKAAEARAFIAQHAPLKFYHDTEMSMSFELSPPAIGMPTTVVYGKDGLERGRVSGEADWAGTEARALIDRVLAEG